MDVQTLLTHSDRVKREPLPSPRGFALRVYPARGLVMVAVSNYGTATLHELVTAVDDLVVDEGRGGD